MTRIALLILWLCLLTPAMNLGKAWQSHAVPGPIVTVDFKTGPVDGHMLYKVDGSAWLRDQQGAERRLDGTETITGQLVSLQERSSLDILSSTWRGIAPMVLITVLLLGIRFRRKS